MIVIEQMQLPNGVMITRLIADDVNSWGTLQRAPTQRSLTRAEKIKKRITELKNHVLMGLDL